MAHSIYRTSNLGELSRAGLA